jgi:hypothetical protein
MATIKKTDWVKLLIPFKNAHVDIKQGTILQVTWIDQTPGVPDLLRAIELDVKNVYGKWDKIWVTAKFLDYHCSWDKYGDNL